MTDTATQEEGAPARSGTVRQRFTIQDRLAGTALEVDQVAPSVPLREHPSGEKVTPTMFRQRRALVLCLLHAGCQPCEDFAADLATLSDDIQSAGGEVRAVLPEAEDSPLPVWVDAEGKARDRMLGSDGELPIVVLLDRYAAASESHPAPDHDFPEPKKVLDTLRHLASLCPECST